MMDTLVAEQRVINSIISDERGDESHDSPWDRWKPSTARNDQVDRPHVKMDKTHVPDIPPSGSVASGIIVDAVENSLCKDEDIDVEILKKEILSRLRELEQTLNQNHREISMFELEIIPELFILGTRCRTLYSLWNGAGDSPTRKMDADSQSVRTASHTFRSFFDYKDSRTAIKGSLIAVPTPADFHGFYWKCMELKGELVRLDFSLRSVGSSGPGIQAVNALKTSLQRLRDVFGTNTSSLFPDDVNVQMFSPPDSRAYMAEFARSFEDFADVLNMTAKALGDFQGVYHDEKLMLLLFSLHKRFTTESIKMSICYGAHRARESEELKFRFQKLLKDWVESAVDSLTEAIKGFNEKGVPTIYSSQNYKTSRYLYMTTIATFFSGVTASMIQLSVNENTHPIGVAVNTFFFSALVFSIGSALHSLLVISWRRSFVREPNQSLNVWLSAWLDSGSTVSLLISGALFSVALGLFTFSSSQHIVTSVATVVVTCFHAAALLFLSGSFVAEKWKFRNQAGPVGKGLTSHSFTMFLIDWLIGKLESLKGLQARQSGALFSTQQTRTRSIEAQQSILSEKMEPFNSLQNQAIWNALSDEKVLMNSMYIHADPHRWMQGDTDSYGRRWQEAPLTRPASSRIKTSHPSHPFASLFGPRSPRSATEMAQKRDSTQSINAKDGGDKGWGMGGSWARDGNLDSEFGERWGAWKGDEECDEDVWAVTEENHDEHRPPAKPAWRTVHESSTPRRRERRTPVVKREPSSDWGISNSVAQPGPARGWRNVQAIPRRSQARRADPESKTNVHTAASFLDGEWATWVPNPVFVPTPPSPPRLSVP